MAPLFRYMLPNGRHFVMIQPVGKKPPAELHVVVNWSDELKARVAAQLIEVEPNESQARGRINHSHPATVATLSRAPKLEPPPPACN